MAASFTTSGGIIAEKEMRIDLATEDWSSTESAKPGFFKYMTWIIGRELYNFGRPEPETTMRLELVTKIQNQEIFLC